mmetsp:Transcript_436/g.874  ORF Transcript_436/g.874 Transcript_436/m.874 type:complete len:287 (+) Transcript_436:1481-2341(+)
MMFEEFFFFLESCTNAQILVNVLLTTIDGRNVSPSQWVYAVQQYIGSIRSGVHQIQFCENSNGTIAVWINSLCHLQCITIGHIRVGRRDSKDNCVWVANKFQNHFLDLFLDVIGLVPHGHFCYPRQIDECQGQDVWRENFEADGVIGNALVATREPIGFANNFLSNLFKRMKPASGRVRKFTPFDALLVVIVGIGIVVFVLELLHTRRSGIDESQNKRSACYDTGSSGKEAPAHDTLQDTGFPGRLATDHDDLWKVQLSVLTDSTQNILELGYDGNQLIHPIFPIE